MSALNLWQEERWEIKKIRVGAWERKWMVCQNKPGWRSEPLQNSIVLLTQVLIFFIQPKQYLPSTSETAFQEAFHFETCSFIHFFPIFFTHITCREEQKPCQLSTEWIANKSLWCCCGSGWLLFVCFTNSFLLYYPSGSGWSTWGQCFTITAVRLRRPGTACAKRQCLSFPMHLTHTFFILIEDIMSQTVLISVCCLVSLYVW